MGVFLLLHYDIVRDINIQVTAFEDYTIVRSAVLVQFKEGVAHFEARLSILARTTAADADAIRSRSLSRNSNLVFAIQIFHLNILLKDNILSHGLQSTIDHFSIKSARQSS